MNAKKAFIIFKPSEILIEEYFLNMKKYINMYTHTHIYICVRVAMCVYPPKYASYLMGKH